LVVRGGVQVSPLLFGGFQQGGTRPGTQLVALAVGFCQALVAWRRELQDRAARLQMMRDRLEAALMAGYPDAVIVGREAPRLPHTSNVAFVGIDRQALQMALDLAGIACSTGSACASGSSEPSPVLTAMEAPEAVWRSSNRLSLGALSTPSEVDEAARRILLTCQRLRPQ
jgi:cysteine desulfurase